jgi:hypothetical protein
MKRIEKETEKLIILMLADLRLAKPDPTPEGKHGRGSSSFPGALKR